MMDHDVDKAVEQHPEAGTAFVAEADDKDLVATERVVETSEEDNSSSEVEQHKHNENESSTTSHTFPERLAMRMANQPCTHLLVSLMLSIALSAIGLIVGDFSVAVDNAGWQSRGTLIADRQTQLMLTQFNVETLFYGDESDWNDLIQNVQPGWESSGDDNFDRRRLMLEEQVVSKQSQTRVPPLQWTPTLQRQLQERAAIDLPGCDVSWYEDYDQSYHLWPIWKTKRVEASALNPDLILELCESEQETQRVLEQAGLCFGCSDGTSCLPPFGLVLYARLQVGDTGLQLSCSELKDAWAPYEAQTQAQWQDCVAAIKANYTDDDPTLPSTCPFGFTTDLVQYDYDENELVLYTSSIFPTREDDIDALYDHVDDFGKGNQKTIEGAYDTKGEHFSIIFTDGAVARDMSLAMGSAMVTGLAIIIHTRSLFLTGIGLLQIVLSFPLAYFTYALVAQLEFFPFLNFIGVFVVFALGAGDIFVAVDKWKNARLDHPSASTEQVAALALPESAGAMFLTTITTAIAFFGTAICPVAPIKLFAVFCGLLILFDYIMCVLLVFPALCIYDRKREEAGVDGKPNCCITCHCCRRFEAGGARGDDEDAKPSLIRRVLLGFYGILHKFRYLFLAACAAGLGISIYFATTLELPTSAEVRIVDESFEFEKNYAWRQELLSTVLQKSGGAECNFIFGTQPADTGDQNNPESWSQLVLDKSFDPSSQDAQMFLLKFCDNLFGQAFADEVTDDFECSMNKFHAWLGDQAALSEDQQSAIYLEHCGTASGIPMDPNNFHACMTAWAQAETELYVLSKSGIVTILMVPFTARVRWDSPFDELDTEWNLIEEWIDDVNADAPKEVSKGYFSNLDFWWYDTNKSMLATAYGAAGIALGAAAGVILCSSRSVTLTLYSVITIGYILTSVTATLVGFGWTLGFLESICFAILIGVSVDFVIHFSHSYSLWKGEHDRGERTQHALIQMGPSILATAFTTFCAAVVMMFTIIIFFQKFALILFMTIVQATIGTFIVFLTMTDTIGPSHPTYLVDKLTGALQKKDAAETGTDVKKNSGLTKEATASSSKMMMEPTAELSAPQEQENQ